MPKQWDKDDVVCPVCSGTGKMVCLLCYGSGRYTTGYMITEAFKKNIVDLYYRNIRGGAKHDLTIKKIASKLKLTRTTIYNWIKKFGEKGEQSKQSEVYPE